MGTKLNHANHQVDILALSRLKVLDEDSNPILLSSFWKNNNVVLIFVRHFGCIACRAHIDQVWKKREQFERAKTKIIFIGNGDPALIKSFKQDLNVDAPIFTDPTMEVFDACGLKRSLLRLFSLSSGKRIIGLSRQGYKQGATFDSRTGTHAQMGGVVAFKVPGIVVYHFIADHLGDFDDSEDWGGQS